MAAIVRFIPCLAPRVEFESVRATPGRADTQERFGTAMAISLGRSRV